MVRTGLAPIRPSLKASEEEMVRINSHSLFDEAQFNAAASLLDVSEISAIVVPLLRVELCYTLLL